MVSSNKTRTMCWSQIESQSKDYYPTIDEKANEDFDADNRHLSPMNKDWVMSLFLELL